MFFLPLNFIFVSIHYDEQKNLHDLDLKQGLEEGQEKDKIWSKVVGFVSIFNVNHWADVNSNDWVDNWKVTKITDPVDKRVLVVVVVVHVITEIELTER